MTKDSDFDGLQDWQAQQEHDRAEYESACEDLYERTAPKVAPADRELLRKALCPWVSSEPPETQLNLIEMGVAT